MSIVHEQDVAAYVCRLAREHGVVYQPTATDLWGHQITRLAGDSIQLDDTELLLLALRRAGHLTSGEAMSLLRAYLHQIAP